MIQRMLASALFAGFAAGLLAALLHFAFVQELILLGEEYETGELVHFQNMAGAETPAADPSHDDAATEAHDHAPVPEGAALARNGMTVLFTALIYVSYALLLVAGFALAAHYGRAVTAREGLLWGLGGFAAFQLAPALGLAPELPGTIAAELAARQVWWLGTAAATATALAVLGYGRGWMAIAVAGALLAAPHVIGAPEPAQMMGVAPPEVAAAFAARVLGVGLASWAMLGWLAGHFWAAKSA